MPFFEKILFVKYLKNLVRALIYHLYRNISIVFYYFLNKKRPALKYLSFSPFGYNFTNISKLVTGITSALLSLHRFAQEENLDSTRIEVLTFHSLIVAFKGCKMFECALNLEKLMHRGPGMRSIVHRNLNAIRLKLLESLDILFNIPLVECAACLHQNAYFFSLRFFGPQELSKVLAGQTFQVNFVNVVTILHHLRHLLNMWLVQE